MAQVGFSRSDGAMATKLYSDGVVGMAQTAPAGVLLFRLSPPAKMCKPLVRPLNSFAVSIQWTPPVDVAAQRGGRFRPEQQQLLVSGYRVRYQAINLDDTPMGDFVAVGDTWPSHSKKASLKWLKSGLCYVFQVMAFNDAGDGEWSDVSDPFLMPSKPGDEGSQGAVSPAGTLPTPRGTPRSLPQLQDEVCPPLKLSNHANTIEISWKEPCHRGAPIVAYDIRYSKDQTFSKAVQEVSVGGSETKVVLEDLEPNTIYYFMHRARNEVGISKWSPPSNGIATLGRAPQPPEPPVLCGEPRPTEIVIKWEPPESYGLHIEQYRVCVGQSPTMEGSEEVGFGGRMPPPDAAGGMGVKGVIPKSPLQRRLAGKGAGKAGAGLTQSGLVKPMMAQVPQLKINGLRPNTAYYFQVRASNQIGESAWSAPSQVLRTAVSPPSRTGAPQFVSGTRAEGMRLLWVAPDSYGLPVTRYDVRASQRRDIGDHNSQELSDVKVTSAVPDTEVANSGTEEMGALATGCWPPGVDHYYQVRGWNEAGPGEWSPVSACMRIAPTAPDMPKAPVTAVAKPLGIVVRWAPPFSPGSEITGYRLRYSTSETMADPVEAAGLTGVGTSHGVPGLRPDTVYFFQVAGINTIGCGDWSPASQGLTTLQAAPKRMTAPYFIRRTTTSVTVGFHEPSIEVDLERELIRSYTLMSAPFPKKQGDASKDCADRRQSVEMRLEAEPQPSYPAGGMPALGDVAWNARGHPDAQPSGTEITGLQPGRVCEFYVVAVNEFGEGRPGEVAQFSTDSDVPVAPLPPVKLDQAQTSLTVEISPPDDNGSHITHYRLLVLHEATEFRLEVGPIDAPGHDSEFSHCVQGLQPGYKYSVHAAAINAIGMSAWSNAAMDLETASSSPRQVKTPRTTAVGQNSFTIEWDAPFNNGSEITEYIVRWAAAPEKSPSPTKSGQRASTTAIPRKIREAITTETSFVCEDCVQGCDSFARVAAQNKHGPGLFSDKLEVKLMPGMPFPPGAHTSIFQKVSYTSLRLQWNTPYDGGTKITGYRIYFEETDASGRTDLALDAGEITTDASKSYKDIFNLRPQGEYRFRVAAENEQGVGLPSESFGPQQLLAPAPPMAPEKPPVFVSTSVTSLVVRMQLPYSNGSIATEHVFHVSMKPEMPKEECVEIVLPCGTELTKWTPVSKQSAYARLRSAMGLEAEVEAEGPSWVVAPHHVGSLELLQHKGITGEWPDGSVLWEDEVSASGGEVSGDTATALSRASGDLRSRRIVPGEYMYELPGLRGGTMYYVAAAMRNAIGQGEFGPVSEVMETGRAEPLPIVQIRIRCKDHKSLTFEWDEPDFQGSPVEMYTIRCAPSKAELLRATCPEHEILIGDVEDTATPSHTFHGLLPGTPYFAVVRSMNAKGWSDWTHTEDECRTDPMVPTKMDMVTPAVEARTDTSITFQYELPNPRGSDIHTVEIRYMACPIEHGEICEPGEAAWNMLMKDGQSVFVQQDPETGELPKSHEIAGLEPHSVVVAVCRAVNGVGEGEWSDKPCRDMSQLDLGVDFTAAPAAPTVPEAPVFAADIGAHKATAEFTLGKANGSLYTWLEFRLYAAVQGEELEQLEGPLGEDDQTPLREWMEEFPREENCQVLRNLLGLRRVLEVQPGTVYALKVRAENGAGTSPWSLVGPPARTLPDRPVQDTILMVENTSPIHIKVRWRPPYHNGAPIEGYEIRYTDDTQDTPYDEWTVIHNDTIRQTWGASQALEGSHAYGVYNLRQGRAHFFEFRAFNRCGYSDWSEASTFFTRSSPPARVDLCPAGSSMICLKPRRIDMEWPKPNDYGSPIKRYEIVASRKVNLVRWCRLVCEKLWWTPDLLVIFGLFGMADTEFREGGRKTLLHMECDAAFFGAEQQPSTKLGELIPGKEYYTMVRAVSDFGKGNWSHVFGPQLTPPTVPAKPCELEVNEISGQHCHVFFKIPYDNGKPITSAVLVAERIGGPLSEDEKDHTGEALGHHLRREQPFNPWEAEKDGATIDGLLAGTEYEVTWACVNECGLGPSSTPVMVTTSSGEPDMPELIYDEDED